MNNVVKNISFNVFQGQDQPIPSGKIEVEVSEKILIGGNHLEVIENKFKYSVYLLPDEIKQKYVALWKETVEWIQKETKKHE